MPEQIYLDNAATTPLEPAVLEAMMPYLTQNFGNPASLHRAGNTARIAIEKAAGQLAEALHCEPEQIVFTSGGSMSNNLAVDSAVSFLPKNTNLFTTTIEHTSLLAPMQMYADRLTVGTVDSFGYLLTLPGADTAFASVQFANNELGTVQDMKKISEYCRSHGILLHSDAVSAFGQLPIDLKSLPIDMLSVSAHKFSGPKGVGALFVRDRRRLSPFILGNNKTTPIAGTENVAGIVGMGMAAEIYHKNLSAHTRHKEKLKQLLKAEILSRIPQIKILSPEDQALCGILSVCIPGTDSESLLTLLDLYGVCASAGSACHAGEKETSHVMKAIGVEKQCERSVIRFSVGIQNTEDEIRSTAKILDEAVKKLRSLNDQ